MKLPVFSMLALALCLGDDALQAQERGNKQPDIKQKETVIIKKRDAGSPQTVVEIKDGDIYVNGEKVATTGNTSINKKIIIDGDDDIADTERFSFGYDNTMRKPMLGVITNPDKSANGAYIDRITPGSAAKDAGLKEGDVITRIDEKPINNPKELVDAIGQHEVGDKVAITYERNGKTNHAEATLSGMLPNNFSRQYGFRMPPGMDELDIPNPMIPFTFDVNDGFREAGPKLGVTAEDRADENGVTILDIKPGSAAEAAGLQKHDVIVKLDDEKIGSVDDLQQTLRQAKTNEKIKLQYQRNGKMSSTDIILPKPTKKKDL